MKKIQKILFALGLLVTLGACEKVKEKEVAALPVTSIGDTLVLEPDSVEIDTTFAEGETSPYGEYEDNPWEPVEGATDGDYSENGTVRNGSATSAGVNNTRSSSASSVTTTTTTTEKKSSSSATTPKASPVRKRYVRPTAAQLQNSLARDARVSSQMSLTRLKNYWMTRQHYYRRASKEVKFVAGPTKIKISQEETKIETAKGKVKIEGDDIKVKPE